MAESIESASKWLAGDRQDRADVIYRQCGRGRGEGGSPEMAPVEGDYGRARACGRRMGLMGKHRWRRFAASMIGVEADDEVAQRQAVLANGLSDAHPSAKRLTPAWRPSSARDLAMPCEDAQVALTAVVVCGHIASVEERGDALEASVQPGLQPLHVILQPRVALVDDASESHARSVSGGSVSTHLCLLGIDVPGADAVTKVLGSWAGAALGDLLGFPHHVSAAVGMAPLVMARVDAVEVGHEHAAEVRPQHLFGHPRPARQLDTKERRRVGACDPCPTADAVLPQPRLVLADNRRVADVRLNLVNGWLRALALACQQVRHTPGGDPQTKPHSQERRDTAE